jgi:lysophospholipase L1-like esterase
VTQTKPRPLGPERFLRGALQPPHPDAPYPRADPSPLGERLPRDTWAAACIPAGVRFEWVGDARSVEVEYETRTDDLGYRGDGAGRHFSLFQGERLTDEAEAKLGRGSVRLECDPKDTTRRVLYLPEGMRPTVLALHAEGGSMQPAPVQPIWLCYGDSIAEGWSATGPASSWPAVAARRVGLDLVNMGYAGAARGEIVSAEQLAALPADVISLSHGTNCWSRTPHSEGMFREGLRAFLALVRRGHPQTRIVAVSPLLRPDAEHTRNILGATLADLRRAFESVVQERRAAGDDALSLLPGEKLVTPEQLADEVHPDDAGHRAVANAIAPLLSGASPESAG